MITLLTKSIKYPAVLALSISLILAGCNSSSSVPTIPAEVSSRTSESSNQTTRTTDREDQEDQLSFSKNKEIQVTLPPNWKKFTDSKMQMLFTATDKQANKIISINRISKSDLAPGATLNDFSKLNSDAYSIGFEAKPEDIHTDTLTIDSQTVPVTDSIGTVNGEQMYYMGTSLDGENHFYRIVLLHPGGSADEDHDEFVRIVESVKILNDEITGEDTGRSSIFKKTVKNKDGQIGIRIPSNWVTGIELVPDADIQAVFVSNEDYMAVVREAKEDVGTDITLQDYYNFIIENNINPDGVASISDPVPVNINGMSGLQIEAHTEIDKVKVAYVYTFLESESHFSQIIFWTSDGRFNNVKKEYKEYTESYREYK